MKNASRFFPVLRLVLATAVSVLTSPAETSPPAAASPGPESRELWVPQKNLAEVLKSSPKSVVLTAGQYATLLRDSRPLQPEEKPVPPAPAVLTGARYEGTPSERFVTLHAEFMVRCFTAEWTEVPLELNPRWMGKVTVDGESAVRPLTVNGVQGVSAVLLVRGVGEHRLEVDFAQPVNDGPGRRSFVFRPPGAVGVVLSLALPEGAKVESSVPFRQENGPVVFALPAQADAVRIAWTPQEVAPLESGALFQDCGMTFGMDPVRLSADLLLSWRSPLRPLPPQLVLPLSAGDAVLGVDGPEVRQWTLAGDRMVVDFLPGTRREASLRLTLERGLTFPDGGAPLRLELPAPVAEGVFRTSGQFSLLATPDLRVRAVEAGPLAVRDDSRSAAATRMPGVEPFGTWIFPVLPSPPVVVVQPLAVQFAATLDTQLSLDRDAVRLTRWLTLTPRDGTLFSPRIAGLRADEEIVSVLAPDGRELTWRKSGDGLVFPDNTGISAGKPWTAVIRTRLDPAGWQSMAGQPLPLVFHSVKIPGAGKVNGYLALDFDDALQVTTNPGAGLEPRDPRQFAGTLPLTGRLAWSRLDDYQLDLTVSRRAPEYDASVLLYALPLLNSLEVEGALTLAIDRSPLRELRVVFPAAAAASVRWDSPLLAESSLEPDNSWRLRFHQETDGKPTLRFRLSLPLTDATGSASAPGTDGNASAAERRFTVEAPVPAVTGARRLSGTVVVEANTDTELTFSPSGLNPLDTLRAPALAGYMPRHRVVSAWTWPGGIPALTVRGVRHRAGSLVSTVIDRLVLDTVVSPDGPLRHQARMEVRTAGDQYLDVVLPADSRILTLLVNEAATKPVRNRQGGLRIPLADPVAVIRLICECPGSGMSAAASAQLVPVTPDPALPVMETQWRLHLPDGFSYSAFDTNLTESATAATRPPSAPPVLALAVEVWNPFSGTIMSGSKRSVIRSSLQATASADASAGKLRELLAERDSREKEVDLARQEMLVVLKKYGRSDKDLKQLEDSLKGGGAAPVIGSSNNLYLPTNESMEEMSSALSRFKTQLDELSKLEGDGLLVRFRSIAIDDEELKRTMAEKGRIEKEIMDMQARGVGGSDPEVERLKGIEKELRQKLLAGAENFRETLKVNIANLEAALGSVNGEPGGKFDNSEYVLAKSKWEEKLELFRLANASADSEKQRLEDGQKLKKQKLAEEKLRIAQNPANQERVKRVNEVLEQKLREQEEKVADARIETMRLMKLYGITETSLLGQGGATPFVGATNQLYMMSREKELEMRTQVEKFKANLESLKNLEGEDLITKAASYAVEDDTIKHFTTKWRDDRVEYARLTGSGLGEKNSKVMAVQAAIQEEEKFLKSAAENYKETLEVNIRNIENALNSIQAASKETKEENLNEKMNSAEYAKVKDNYLQEQELLSRLRETVMKTKLAEEYEAAGGDRKNLVLGDTADVKENFDIARGAEVSTSAESKSLIAATAPEEPPPAPARPGLQTRTFRVPLDFLNRGAVAGSAADAADPFSSADGGSGLSSRPTSKAILEQMGVEFGEGAVATYSADTGTLVVRNTAEQLDNVETVVEPMLKAGKDGLEGGSAEISDREGILPLDFDLPEGGRVYQFSGQYPPGALTFRYQSWERQMRWNWLWMILGGAAFWLTGRRSPWITGVLGAVMLQLVPSSFNRPDWMPVANALIIGWIFAALLRVIHRRVTRKKLGAMAAWAAAHRAMGSVGLLLLLGLSREGDAQAQEPVAVSAAELPSVVVPYDPEKPIDTQKPDQRYLDYDTFQRLWKAARENRKQVAENAVAAPSTGERGFVLTNALHRAAVDGKVLRVESIYTLLTHGPDWVSVPFALQNGLRELTLDGAPAALRDGELLVEKAGTHALRAAYDAPLPGGWQEVSWQVPPATAAALSFALPLTDPAQPVVNDGAPLQTVLADGRREFTAVLGSATAVSVKRQVAVRRAGTQAVDPALARVVSRIFATPAMERLEASVDFSFPGQDRAEFTLKLDAGLTPVRFSVPGMRDWSLRPEDGWQVLDVILERPVRAGFQVKLVVERPVGPLPLTENAPAVTASALRVEQQWSVLATDDVEVRPLPDAGHQRVNFATGQGGEDEGFNAIGTWRASAETAAPLRWELRPRAPEPTATIRYALQPGTGKLELSAGLELTPGEGQDLRDITIRVPVGATVQGVTGERLADWWHEGTALRVRFTGGGPGLTALALNLTRPVPADAAEVVFTPLVVEGFSKVSGSGLLIAPVNQEAVLRLAPAGPELREVAPQEAATGFTIQPPLEEKRGFVFTGADWTATASLKPLAPRFDVDWVLDAEVRDSWVELNARVLLGVTRGGLERIEFTTPAGAPDFRITGADVRESVSSVEGAVRRYNISFQSLRTGAALFTLTGQMPLTGAEGLPDFDFPGAARISRFVILDDKSDGRMNVVSAGLEATPREQVSFLPAELASGQTGAQFFRARPGWSLRPEVEKLETSAGQAAVVPQADLTTSLLRNGDVWQRAVYTLQNRTLQFLPVHLPEGAEVVSVVVRDETTRADQGTVNGLSVLLVPLIQTEPGELSTEVKLIYRLRGKPGETPRALDDPDLPGLSIGQTFWTVEYPDGWTLDSPGGNMTPVDDHGLEVERQASQLSELVSLSSIVSSDKYDRSTRERAAFNAQKITGELGDTVDDSQQVEYTRLVEDLKKSGPQQAPEITQELRVTQGVERGAKTFVGNQLSVRQMEDLNQRTAGKNVSGPVSNLNDNVGWTATADSQRAPEGMAAERKTAATGSDRRRLSQIDRLRQRSLAEGDGDGGENVDRSKKMAGKSDLEGLDFETKTLAGDDLKDGEKAVEAEARKQQEFQSQNGDYSFRNARLNSQIRQDVQTASEFSNETKPAAKPASAAGAASPQEPRQASGDQPGNGPVTLGRGDRPPDSEPSAGGAPEVGQDLFQSMDEVSFTAAQSRLRTTGRTSLDSVFPSQTKAAHFKKVNGNATLEFRLKKPAGTRINWTSAAWCILCLGLLIAARSWSTGRKKAAA